MELTRKDVADFKKLFIKYFKIDLDDNKARHKLSLLVRQMEIVYQPITKQQLEDLLVRDAQKRDAMALAELVYDVFKDGTHAGK